MALIKCPECGREISDTVKACPGCGVVINAEKKLDTKWVIRILLGIGILVVAFWGLDTMHKKAEAEKLAQRIAAEEAERVEAERREQQRILDVWYDLDISDVDGYNNKKISGTLTNNSDYTVYFVKVKFIFSDSGGKVIDTDSTYAVGGEGLEPGESCKFDTYSSYWMKDITAEVYDFSLD